MGILSVFLAIPDQVPQVITLISFDQFIEASLGLVLMVGAAVFFKRAKKRKLKKLKEQQERIDKERNKRD